MSENLFNSFLMGGFECSTHRNRAGKRLDMIAATRHDEFAEPDYERLMRLGLRTARDGVRWHLIEVEPGRFDFSSLEKQVAAVKATGIQIIWDIFHYGFPDDVDVTNRQFADRFARFAAATCEFLASELGPKLVICPVNEISFFSWAAGTAAVFHPFKKKKGRTIKSNLIDAACASLDRIRELVPDVRWIFTEPAIHVVPSATRSNKRRAESYRLAQFEALDALADQGCLDMIGLNYYIHNQWRHPSRRPLPLGHKEYRPPHEIFAEFYKRYNRPMLISETGIEDERRPQWFRFVWSEAQAARERGVPVDGLCLYPIINHPGWEDNRHCHNGLWDYADPSGGRESYPPLESAIREVNEMPMRY
jgi:beta-glucosidase/6-phospho-beta-glucosidase/beta-galactosidase